MTTASANNEPDPKKYLYTSVRDVVIDKIISFLFGFAALILGSIIVPIVGIAFRQYAPLDTFLTSYWEFCLAICVVTLVTLKLALRKWRPAYAFGLHAVLSAIALVISGMMRRNIGLPNIVLIQFLFYFFAIAVICEIFLIAFARATYRACKVSRGK